MVKFSLLVNAEGAGGKKRLKTISATSSTPLLAVSAGVGRGWALRSSSRICAWPVSPTSRNSRDGASAPSSRGARAAAVAAGRRWSCRPRRRLPKPTMSSPTMTRCHTSSRPMPTTTRQLPPSRAPRSPKSGLEHARGRTPRSPKSGLQHDARQ